MTDVRIVVVREPPRRVVVMAPGPQGVPGDPGTGGAGGITEETDPIAVPLVEAEEARATAAEATKAALSHTHAQSDVTGLVSALAAKQDASSAATAAELAAAVATLNTALDGKATPADITAAIDALVDGAPGALDTLNELAAALADDEDAVAALTTVVASKAAASDLAAFIARTDNPHGVTKAQVGLGSADNTADVDKPVSTAQQTALDLKANSADLGTAAAADTTDFDPAGAAAAAQVAAEGYTDTASGLLIPKADRPVAALASDLSLTVNTATLQDVTGLGLAIGASATEIWRVTYWLAVSAGNVTMDLKVGFTVPSGCTMIWGSIPASATFGWGSVAVGSTPAATLSESGTFTAGTRSGATGVPITAIVIGGGTAGTVQIQATQNTADFGALKILKGSLMEAVKVAA